ncbi:hypothetical protein [Iodobacter fluviatilis]|uniref:Uncharacterized protein n=1 Tax=Iodobacter fluviatilis TaxID=537 RepID=A0A377Q796_9NEIS|nr:hypothetical protein [Iodobacter fluviatilis]TCU89229.1 hypothetical protein EV682_102141 [Iodobacter fluviatilis]STQ90598.1 Uncharacterised protein [Iodobacter fluviatilis]
MLEKKRSAVLPVVLIAVGGGWLINELQLMPQMGTLIILGLIAAGIAVLALEGINKSSVVTAPMLIATGFALYLKDYHGVGLKLSIPALMVLAGLLMLLARSSHIADRAEQSAQE